jgi:uncharacterized protein (TIGR02996 family)
MPSSIANDRCVDGLRLVYADRLEEYGDPARTAKELP